MCIRDRSFTVPLKMEFICDIYATLFRSEDKRIFFCSIPLKKILSASTKPINDFTKLDFPVPVSYTHLNKEELVASLQATGWDIYPLSGNEEALYDFLGTKYSYPKMCIRDSH